MLLFVVRRKAQTFMKVHPFLVLDDLALSIWQLFLQHEVALDFHTLLNRGHLDLTTGRGVAKKIHWAIVYGHRNDMILVLVLLLLVPVGVMLSAAVLGTLLRFHGFFSLPIRHVIANMQSLS